MFENDYVKIITARGALIIAENFMKTVENNEKITLSLADALNLIEKDEYASAAFFGLVEAVAVVSHGVKLRVHHLANDRQTLFCSLFKCGKSDCFSCCTASAPITVFGIDSRKHCNIDFLSDVASFDTLVMSHHFCKWSRDNGLLKLQFLVPVLVGGGPLIPFQKATDSRAPLKENDTVSILVHQFLREGLDRFFRRDENKKVWECYEAVKEATPRLVEYYEGPVYGNHFAVIRLALSGVPGKEIKLLFPFPHLKDVIDSFVENPLVGAAKVTMPKTMETVKAEISVLVEQHLPTADDLISLLRHYAHRHIVCARLDFDLKFYNGQATEFEPCLLFYTRSAVTLNHSGNVGFSYKKHLKRVPLPGEILHLLTKSIRIASEHAYTEAIHKIFPFTDAKLYEWSWLNL